MPFRISTIGRAAILSAIICFGRPASGQKRALTAPTPSPSVSVPNPVDKSATHSAWSFLSLGATKDDEFQKEHPTYDGRGVIIMIFDTGVDPGIPGLGETSDGKHKIINVRDESGTGDVTLTQATVNADELLVGTKSVLRGMKALPKPVDGIYYYGVLPEKRFQNGLNDLNFNGNETDNFGIVAFQDATNHWVAYVDSDGDGSVSNEKQLTSYRERYDLFRFHSTDSVASSGKGLTGAINLDPARKHVSVYFDDGSHGTHVAGIAAGHDIDNQKGFNGVAPGAELIAVKFADNTAGGVTVSGSMKRAFEYAAELATTQAKPVVVNMSFGIGNELEGSSMMDKWLDSLLAAVPNLTVCVSAGNEGPGLSSIGLPGSAERIISSGAALPDDAARDLYNLYATHPLLFDFSSRGGELAKPDLVSPGTAVSTVPDYVGGDRYNGTSMSSPYTAGCSAVLLSAMRQAFPDWPVSAFAIKRAMMLSAHHIDGATQLDEGGGMIDIPAAFDLLSKWVRHGTTPVPVHIVAAGQSNPSGTAAYFRSGTFPGSAGHEGERETFSVQPEEPRGIGVRQKALGMESFDLVSDAAWMSPIESSIYRRGSGAMNVDVRYNAKLLQKPGLYTSRIIGYSKGAPHTADEARFELWSTIVVPLAFSDQNEYRIELRDQKLVPGAVQRYFLAMPPGAKAAKVTLAARDDKGQCTARMFDNEGHEFSGITLRHASAQRTASQYLTGRELPRGICEIDISRTMVSEDERDMTVDLTVDVQPLDVSVSSSLNSAEHPVAHAMLSNPSSRTFSAQPDGTLLGYERTIDTVITAGDLFELPFGARSGERAAIFDVSMPPEDWNLFTDITCMVLRPDSSALYNSAFDYRHKIVPVNFDNTAAASDDDEEESNASSHGGSVRESQLLLRIRGGLAVPDREHAWHLRIHEYRYVTHDQSLAASPSLLRLAPYESQEIMLHSDKAVPNPPDGYRLFGQLELKKSDLDAIRIPLEF